MAFAVIPILSLDKDGATSTLLSFGGINVLFDCGLTNINHMQKYDYHASLMTRLDIILISRADLQYSGAYPFICAKYRFKGRAFSTVPSKHLSMIIFRMLVLRLFPKEQFTQEQTKRFFSKVFKIQDAIEGVCFSDKRNFEVNGRHVDITAFNCGNSIGGAMWRLCIETFSVGYLVEYNHQSELHLDGLQAEELSYKHFSLLITSSYCCEKPKEKEKIRMDPTYLNNRIQEIIAERKGRSFVFLTRSTSRFLEYILQIERVLTEMRTAEKYRFLVPQSMDKYLKDMKYLSEFMARSLPDLVNEDEKDRPLKHYELVTSAQLEQISPDTKVLVLALESDFLFGSASDFYSKFLEDNKKDVLVFMEDYPPGFKDHRMISRGQKIPKQFIDDMLVESEQAMLLEEGDLFSDEEATVPQTRAPGSSYHPTAKPHGLLSQLDGEHSPFDEDEKFTFMDNFFRYSIENSSHLNRTSYGLDLDETMMSELKSINSANQMGLLGPNEMAVPTQDFDCYSEIIVDSAKEVKIPCACFQLLYTGISDIYSMGVILQKLKVDMLCFVNGSEQKADEIEQVIKANKTVLHRISKMGINGPFEAYEGRMRISHFQTELLDVNSRGFKFKPSGNGQIEYVRVTGKVKVRAAQNLLHAGAGWLDCEEENSTTHNSTFSARGCLDYSSLKEFKLLAFKEFLERKGFSPLLEKGRLVVGGGAVLVKVEQGHLALEGVYGTEYFKVRALLYEHFLN